MKAAVSRAVGSCVLWVCNVSSDTSVTIAAKHQSSIG